MEKKIQTSPAIKKDELFSVIVSSEEMYSLLQILAISKDIFEQMALNAVKENDTKTSQVFSARSQISMALYAKFSDIVNIGEPTSRDIH